MDISSRQLPADERRAVTIEAVVELAASVNHSEITTAAIAKQMNVTQGALFRHFPAKAAIWRAVMEWTAERLLGRIDRAARGIASPVAAMRAMFLSHVEFAVEHPGVPRMMFGELRRAEASPAKLMALTLLGVLVPLLGLFVYVALRSGPLAPVPVTLTTVAPQAITPSLFGIGTVEARYTHKIGPTFAGRLKRVEAQPGDRVKAGQLLGEMDPIDLDDRIGAQDAALKRAEANVLAAQAQLRESGARETFAATQAGRYEQLLAARANLDAARQDQARPRAERDGLPRQRANLRLVAPVDGLVSRRGADPGTTVVAGQAVVEVVEPGSLWISVRFDQQRAPGLRADLPVQIVLRSRACAAVPGLADAVIASQSSNPYVNAVLPMLAGRPNGEARKRALELLEALDMAHRAKAMPSQLSGGEQQRVAIARALVKRPPVILADEPSAPLDSERALTVIRILEQMASQYETAIIVVTHDEKIIPTFKRIYTIRDGRTVEEAGEGRAIV